MKMNMGQHRWKGLRAFFELSMDFPAKYKDFQVLQKRVKHVSRYEKDVASEASSFRNARVSSSGSDSVIFRC
jgi:hypothetical protein